MDGSRSRLATIDMISGGGSGGGGSYSGSAPISVSNNIISIATASATQTGALSAFHFGVFNDKVSDGGILNAGLYLKNSAQVHFGSNMPDSNQATAMLLLASNNFTITTLNATVTSNIELKSRDDLKLNSLNNRIYIQDKEIDFSGWGVGKVLKVTSSTKAEWVNP